MSGRKLKECAYVARFQLMLVLHNGHQFPKTYYFLFVILGHISHFNLILLTHSLLSHGHTLTSADSSRYFLDPAGRSFLRRLNSSRSSAARSNSNARAACFISFRFLHHSDIFSIILCHNKSGGSASGSTQVDYGALPSFLLSAPSCPLRFIQSRQIADAEPGVLPALFFYRTVPLQCRQSRPGSLSNFRAYSRVHAALRQPETPV